MKAYARAWLLALAASYAWGHAVSMSSGDLSIEGSRAHYTLRMPLYEISHTAHPEDALLAHIRFAGAQMTAHQCRTEAAQDSFVCEADYQFDSSPTRLDVECTLYAATVPNHVHLLRATLDGRPDQAIFDFSFPRATLRFRPPTPAEVAASESGAGFLRALAGPAQILFLAALAIAARRRRELAAMLGMFLAGQIAAVLVMPHTAWQPPPRFVEAAAALTVAYLAAEMVLIPQAGSRWLIAGLLGAFHGLYFHLFLQSAGYHAAYVLAGAAAAEIAAVCLLVLLFSRAGKFARAMPPALLVFGLVWFVLRLKD
jgi:HupE / UreJ protein